MYIWHIDYILQEGSLYIDCKYLQYHVEIACKVCHIWVTLEHVIPNHEKTTNSFIFHNKQCNFSVYNLKLAEKECQKEKVKVPYFSFFFSFFFSLHFSLALKYTLKYTFSLLFFLRNELKYYLGVPTV